MSETLDTIMETMQEGLIYLSSNEYKLAEDCYARALDLAESKYGETHFTTKKSLECVARCLYKQKDLVLAVPMYERLVAIHDSTSKANDSGEGDMASVFIELGECFVEVGREEEGIKMKSRGEKLLGVLQDKVEEMEREEEEEEDEEYDDEMKEDEEENKSWEGNRER